MKCKYCNKEITGYVETSKLNPKIKLCQNCYYAETFCITMSKIMQIDKKMILFIGVKLK